MISSKLYTMARISGTSRLKAEQLWVLANRLAKNEGKDNRYALEIVRRMMKIESIPVLTERYMEAAEFGTLHDKQIRAFLDSGNVCFAESDDVLIESGADPRIDLLCAIVNQNDWPEAHDIWEMVENYHGSLEQLFDRVLKLVGMK